jgi:hypothetical protein
MRVFLVQYSDVLFRRKEMHIPISDIAGLPLAHMTVSATPESAARAADAKGVRPTHVSLSGMFSTNASGSFSSSIYTCINTTAASYSTWFAGSCSGSPSFSGITTLGRCDAFNKTTRCVPTGQLPWQAVFGYHLSTDCSGEVTAISVLYRKQSNRVGVHYIRECE